MPVLADHTKASYGGALRIELTKANQGKPKVQT
jgi:hypothetical protein